MTVVNITLRSCLALAATSLVACSTTSEPDYVAKTSAADDYVYIIDYDKIALIEKASRTSHSNVDTYWVNPPVKRIKRSELEAMKAERAKKQ